MPPWRWCAVHGFGPCPTAPPCLPSRTPPVDPILRFGYPVADLREAPFYSFTAAASTSTMAPGSTSSAAVEARTDADPVFLTLTVPAGAEDDEEEEPMEVPGTEPESPPPSSSGSEARLHFLDIGASGSEVALSSSPSPSFGAITGEEPAGSSTTAPSPHTPNGGPLLHRHAHLADMPPCRPGREPGTWSSTARRALHPDGPIASDEVRSSNREEYNRR
ncbi:hypothetical protein PR202_gb25691 [Eleusine coracana subsp. coracana]|uniref:Uncharacterized protein n=1 Tax=Eleusine coracana subsp. coracana TaxID=191504 RepID=A0AAV5FQS7_ELECO|nr:hypothetical protein PR202_gb25691 [Eleusine coracana subsp. coracana]